jgi:hypothetical protein
MTLFTTGDLVFDDETIENSLAAIKDTSHTHLFTQK